MFFSRKVLKFERCGDGKLLVFSNPAGHPENLAMSRNVRKSLSPKLDTQKMAIDVKKGKTLRSCQNAELDTTIFVKTTQISCSGQWH